MRVFDLYNIMNDLSLQSSNVITNPQGMLKNLATSPTNQSTKPKENNFNAIGVLEKVNITRN